MFLYLAITLLILACLFIAGKRKGLSNLALAISFLLLWGVASFRDVSVGLDTASYAAFFHDVASGHVDALDGLSFQNLFMVDGFERGYQLYNYAIGLFTDNFTVFLAISYAFIFYSFYRFIKKYSVNKLMSMAIYISLFFFGSMNHFRQAIALAVLTWGFKYICERKLIKYLLIVGLATLIHQASLVMILAYFLFGRRLSAKSILLYGFVTLAAFFMVDPLIHLLASGNERYEVYITKIDSFQLGSYIIFILYSALLIMAGWLYSRGGLPDDSKERDRLWFYLHMMIMAVIVALVSIKVSALSRFMTYFMMFGILSIPYFFSMNNNKKRINSLTLLLGIILLAYAFVTMLLKPEWLGVWPYDFAIWKVLQ